MLGSAPRKRAGGRVMKRAEVINLSRCPLCRMEIVRWMGRRYENETPTLLAYPCGHTARDMEQRTLAAADGA